MSRSGIEVVPAARPPRAAAGRRGGRPRSARRLLPACPSGPASSDHGPYSPSSGMSPRVTKRLAPLGGPVAGRVEALDAPAPAAGGPGIRRLAHLVADSSIGLNGRSGSAAGRGGSRPTPGPPPRRGRRGPPGRHPAPPSSRRGRPGRSSASRQVTTVWNERSLRASRRHVSPAPSKTGRLVSTFEVFLPGAGPGFVELGDPGRLEVRARSGEDDARHAAAVAEVPGRPGERHGRQIVRDERPEPGLGAGASRVDRRRRPAVQRRRQSRLEVRVGAGGLPVDDAWPGRVEGRPRTHRRR